MLTNWEKPNLNYKKIMVLLLILLAGYLGVQYFSYYEKVDCYQDMSKASLLMRESINKITDLRKEKDIAIDNELDPNRTGIIGENYTNITTTTGDLTSKRTSTNPNFAALMVNYLKNELKLTSNDKIAIGASGSFPALLLATMSAAEILELDVVTIYSLGSSNYGANIKGFTMAELMPILKEEGYFSHGIDAMSLGGIDDTGRGMLADIEELIDIYSNKYDFIYEEDLKKNMKLRLSIYHKKETYPAVFVNIGGNVVNYGTELWDNGLLTDIKVESEPTSLIGYYLSKNIPVINLINIESLAFRQGLKIDPQPLPEPGDGDIYYQINYPRSIATISILIFLIISFCFYIKND